MRHYITEEDDADSISIEIGRGFGPVDIARALNEIRDSATPQIYGIQRGGSISGDVMVKDGTAYFGSWDCHVYCLDAATGELVWKFQTSISTMSSYELDKRKDREPTFSIVHSFDEPDEPMKEEDAAPIGDYGDLSGGYIDTTKMDYLGMRKKGYLKG